MGTISTRSLFVEAVFMSNGRMRDETLGIAEAARLFGLAPSTLRWWERNGLVNPRRGATGRRRYGKAELNRITLIHMARNTGLLSLAEIADFAGGLTGRGERPHWHRTVRARITALEEQIAQLSSARAHLLHTLECSHDDPTECPVFAREISALYPRLGPVIAPPPDHDPRERDETDAVSGEGPGATRDAPQQPSGAPSCRTCGAPVTQPHTGRRRAYCSRACQQRAYRTRHAGSVRESRSGGARVAV
jgi:MerR family transcriptional regulator, copper efflux regulator